MKVNSNTWHAKMYKFSKEMVNEFWVTRDSLDREYDDDGNWVKKQMPFKEKGSVTNLCLYLRYVFLWPVIIIVFQLLVAAAMLWVALIPLANYGFVQATTGSVLFLAVTAAGVAIGWAILKLYSRRLNRIKALSNAKTDDERAQYSSFVDLVTGWICAKKQKFCPAIDIVEEGPSR